MKKHFYLFTWILLTLILVLSASAADKRAASTLQNHHSAKLKVRFLAREVPLPRSSTSNDDIYLASIRWPSGDESRVKLVYSFQHYESDMPAQLIQSGKEFVLKIRRDASCDSSYGAMISVYRNNAKGDLSILRDGLIELAPNSNEGLEDRTVVECYRITPSEIPKRYRE